MFIFIEISIMRKLMFMCFVFCGIVAAGKSNYPISMIIEPTTIKKFSTKPPSKEISSLKIKDIQKSIGRKLTIKEKISIFILKRQLKKIEEGSQSGQTAFILGIVSLVLLISGLFVTSLLLGALITGIIAVVLGTAAKKKNPSDTKARTGALMGWITLGGIALIVILVAAIIASWSWGWG